jgi:Carboxypeptidase regulatory-like domain
MTRVVHLLCCTGLFFSVVANLPAQTFAEVNGTVTDPSGAVMTGAAVTITNTATQQVRRVMTNVSGSYSVPFLPPGAYSLQVEAPGFKTATRQNIELQVGAVQKIDVSLNVGDVSQNVEVTAAAPLLAAESTSVGTVIDNEGIVELPLNGRDYLQLVQLNDHRL